MITRWMLFLVAWPLVGCGAKGGDRAKSESSAGDVAATPVTTNAADPADACRLVSQAEMERFIGPLLEPPYRTKSRRPNPSGDGCFYRARDYRNVMIELDREDGEMGFRMLAGTHGAVDQALGISSDSAAPPGGTWDKAASTFGRFIALKGPSSIIVDPVGSRLDLAAQARLARIALARLDKPLAYDGARAASTRKEVSLTPRNPCSLVTAAEAEALMGKLRAPPHPSEDGTSCLFPLTASFAGTPVDRALQVQWSDGFYSLGEERLATGMAGKTMAKAMGPDMPAVGENTANEAAPWDERITLLGGMITVVKRDVLLKIAADGMGGFDEAKALTLLRSAVSRI